MTLLVAIVIVAAALVGFLFLTLLEARSGKRLFSRVRTVLDQKTEIAASYLGSTDARASLVRTVRMFIDHVVHDIVHVILVAVRFVERTLTRITREIRGRRAKVTQDETAGSQVE